MNKHWSDLIILLLFIAIPIISAIGKWIKDQIDKNRAESEKTFSELGRVQRRQTFKRPKPVSERPIEIFFEPAPPPAEVRESVQDHLEHRPAETISKSVERDIESKVVKDMDDVRWIRRRRRMELDSGAIGEEREGKAKKTRRAQIIPARMNRTALRRAVVMAEILAPPIALRDPDEGQHYF